MKSPPPQFGREDWSQFDFGKWNLDGLRLEGESGALAGLTQRLFTSPEWRQHFAATLPAMKQAVLDYFEQRAKELQRGIDDNAVELRKRNEEAGKQSAAMQESIAAAAAPPVLLADPNSFRLGAKIVDEETRLGLPGLQLRIIDERRQNQPLAETITDLDGNAVLVLSKEQAAELARERIEPTVEVLTPEGKSIHKAENAFSPRPNHVETWVASLSAEANLKAHIDAAQEIKSDREAQLKNLLSKLDRLKDYYDAARDDTTVLMEQAQKIAEEIRG
jgi:hypothetical protein